MKYPGSILVTGASSKIGAVLVEALAEQGADLILHHYRHPIDTLVDTCHRYKVPPKTLQADLTTDSGVEHLIHYVRTEASQLYGIIHLAGDYVRRPLAQTPPHELRRLMALNVEAPFSITQALVPLLIDSKGVVLHWGHPGLAVPRADPSSPAYSLTKIALAQLTRCWALELAPKGVRVHMVVPGATEASPTMPRIPTGHGTPVDQIVQAALFLLEPSLDQCTGQILEVAGGLRL